MWRKILDQARQCPGWPDYYRQRGMDLADVATEADFARLPVLKKSELPRLQKARPPFGQ